MNFLVGIPDGVAGNVLSFWPAATRSYAALRPGTGQLPYRPIRRHDGVYHSITFGDGWYHGKSFEELRLEDYELGRDAGRWWPGGMLQVKARSTSSFENLAADLETLRLI